MLKKKKVCCLSKNKAMMCIHEPGCLAYNRTDREITQYLSKTLCRCAQRWTLLINFYLLLIIAYRSRVQSFCGLNCADYLTKITLQPA